MYKYLFHSQSQPTSKLQNLLLNRHALPLLPRPPPRVGKHVLPPVREHAPLVGGPLEPLDGLDVRPPQASVQVRVALTAAAAAAAAGRRFPPHGAFNAGQPDLEDPEGGVSAEEEVCRDGELFSLSLVVSEMSVRECVSELPRGRIGAD